MNKTKAVFCVFVCVLVLGSVVQGFEIFDLNYVAEEYASFYYGAEDPTQIRGIEFDTDGNLYVGYGAGGIVRVAPDGISEILVYGEYPNFQALEWGGGTAFGDFMFVASPYTDEVVAVDEDGNTSVFDTFYGEPLGLGIDRVGNYGDKFYVGTRYPGRIYAVSDTGEQEFFAETENPDELVVNDIEFDPDGMYGGLMYVSIGSKTIDYNGICSVDLDGNMTQYTVGTKIGMIEFDATEDRQFNGLLYMKRSSHTIKRMWPDGSHEVFMSIPDGTSRGFTFSPDGMYWLQKTGDRSVTIYRITTLLAKAIRDTSEAIEQKEAAIAQVQESLANEELAFNGLAEMLAIGDLGDLSENDIKKAMKKIELSMAEQNRVIGDLEDGIARLELALMFLGVESE